MSPSWGFWKNFDNFLLSSASPASSFALIFLTWSANLVASHPVSSIWGTLKFWPYHNMGTYMGLQWHRQSLVQPYPSPHLCQVVLSEHDPQHGNPWGKTISESYFFFDKKIIPEMKQNMYQIFLMAVSFRFLPTRDTTQQSFMILDKRAMMALSISELKL